MNKNTRDGLFQHSVDFNADLLRNIVSLRESQNLFDDLLTDTTDNRQETNILIAAEMRIKNQAEPGIISRGFHYSTAIEYPFQTEPFMHSRYGDGTYPVWYGSLELDTTIFETSWHMHKELSAIERMDEQVIRERAVYRVNCRALLFDLTGKETAYPELIAEHFHFTQALGRRIQEEGHPGLLVPSVRHIRSAQHGTNAVIFQQRVLRQARPYCYLTYTYHPPASSQRPHISITRQPGEAYLDIHY